MPPSEEIYNQICQATECGQLALDDENLCGRCSDANLLAQSAYNMLTRSDISPQSLCSSDGCNNLPEEGYASCTECQDFVKQYSESKITPTSTITVSAPDILKAGAKHMEDRAATYDKPGGERSIYATVAAFNAITGHKLTTEQGWLFMGVLKDVRSQSGEYKADNYEDRAAYAALQGETAAQERQ